MLLLIFTFLSSIAYASDFVVLDMKDYYDESHRSQFIKELSSGFHDVGVVIVTNTGINRELVTRAFRAMERFFALDEKIKRKYEGIDHYERGYLPFRSEKGIGAVEGDYKEIYHFGKDNNQYPIEIDIQDSISPYFRELENYMHIFQEAIAISMGMPTGFFIPMTNEGESILRAIHYPPHLGVWAEEHTDTDLFSIFPKATLDGLEIKNSEGNWIKVDVPEGGMIITVGQFLENLSNGYFRAGRQRVVSYKKQLDRYALGFFVHPRDSISLAPLPKMIEKTGGMKKYGDLNRREFLIQTMRTLYDRTAEPNLKGTS